MLCNQCEGEEALVRVRNTLTRHEVGACLECAARIERTMLGVEIAGPVDSPVARVEWARREIRRSACAMIEILPLADILMALPTSWLPEYALDVVLETLVGSAAA